MSTIALYLTWVQNISTQWHFRRNPADLAGISVFIKQSSMLKKLSYFILILFATFQTYAQNKIEFNNTYGSSLYSYGMKSIQDKDNGYFILANTSGSQSGNTNIHIIKTDSNGVILWEHFIGDTSVYWVSDFSRTHDKGFIISGYTNKNFLNGYDVLLVKTDSMTNVQWMKTYGGRDWDFGYSVIETKDTCYVVAGKTYGFGAKDADVYVIKAKMNGDTIWTKLFGGDSTDYASSIINTYENSYLIGANTKSKGAGDFDGWILNLNPAGDTIWTRIYGGAKADILYSIINTPDSAFAFCGSTRSDPAINLECWFVRTLKSGWSDWWLPQTWTIGPQDEAYFDLCLNKKDQYVMAGYTTSSGTGLKDLMYLVMGEHYDFYCSNTFGTLYDEYAAAVGVASDSNIYVIGNTGGSDFAIDNILFIKTGDSCHHSDTTKHITDIESYTASQSGNLVVFPSPTNNVFTAKVGNIKENGVVRFVVYNSLGQQIFFRETKTTADSLSEIFDLSGFRKGLYFIKVYLSGSSYSSGIILN
jgi:hypothetical protein